MWITGLANIFSGKPVHPVGPDGRMALSDHFRELRARVLKISLILVLGVAVSLVFHQQLLDVVQGPYRDAQARLPVGQTEATTQGPGAGLLLYLKLSGLSSIVGTSPFWLYQIWAFIMPGLHAHERKWSKLFVVIAGPLFLAGVWLGYITLPKGLEILIGLNPEGVVNLVEFNDYLTFFSRTLIVFGIALEIPLFVVLLNFAGVISGRSLARHRAWIVIGTFLFAAIATPSGDPFTMTFMAVPMVLLFAVSEVIARFNDRRRARNAPNAGLSPDEMSPL